MPLNLRHLNWEPTGRKYEVLDENNQPTGKLCWAGICGEQNVQAADGKWHPYLLDGDDIRYANSDLRISLTSDKQVLKQAANTLCKSLKFFVQRWQGNKWVDVAHGLPVRNVLHNKRYRNKELIDDEGYAIGYLTFPDAAYDLQIGLQAGRSNRAIFGFRFRAQINGQVRFQIVKDGIEAPLNGIELVRATGGKGTEERIVGIRWKNIFWRWTWEEALTHSVSVDDSTDYPGEKKGIITVGPFDYSSNTWIEVVPSTWGPTEAADDCFEEVGGNWYAHASNNLWIGITKYNVGITFSNVTASGTAENGCYIRVNSTQSVGTGGTANWYAINQRNVTTWASGYRPAAAAKHANSVSWTDIGGGTGYRNSPEIKTLIQDRFSDDHASGDEIGFVGIHGSATGSEARFISTEHATSKAAQLYIVYTAGGETTTLTAAQGSAAITGQAANLLWHQKIKAEQGAAAITGQAAKLLWHQKIKAEQGAAAITGQAANLLWHQKIKAEQGAAAITGQSARLQWHHSLKAEQGALAISGQAATLTYTPAAVVRTLTAEQGSVAINGQAALLKATRTFKGEQGAAAITGQAVRLQWHHSLKAEQGAVAITGQDATLKYTGVYTMNAEQGSVTITGQAARLQKTWSLKCNHAQTTAYVSIGADIPGLPLDRLYWHQAIKAVQGSAAITGQAARLQWHHKVKAEQASVAISAQAAPLTWNRLLKAEAAALAITGNDIDFYASRLLRAEQGAVAIAGQDATLTYSGAPVLVAPAERTCKVGAESRVMIIEAENRTIVVPAEARHVDI